MENQHDRCTVEDRERHDGARDSWARSSVSAVAATAPSPSGATRPQRGRGLALMRRLTELELQVDEDCVTVRLRPSRV